MSGYPHGLSAPTEIKPVTHVTEWREDGVATVMWCGTKYLFNAALVLEPGETKPCPVCWIELHHDEKKKEVVENPKLSPTEPGGQMNVCEALEKLLAQDVYHCDDYDDDARLLAPIIERAVDKLIVAMSDAHLSAMPQKVRARWHAVFVAAMTEGP